MKLRILSPHLKQKEKYHLCFRLKMCSTKPYEVKTVCMIFKKNASNEEAIHTVNKLGNVICV